MTATIAAGSAVPLPYDRFDPTPAALPLPAPRLAEITRWFAGRLRAGELGPVQFGDPAHPDDPEARWHVRVHADATVDVWVISWLPSQGTRLHDHGGSTGAFTVVEGELHEAVWGSGALHDRTHGAGTTTTFGERHVHDVRNLGVAPSVSVHAYSRPLERMGYYDVVGGGLHLASVLDTTDPEPVS